MDVAAQRRVIGLFDMAMDWPDAARQARLGALLADEPDILAAVLAMVDADSRSHLLPTLPPEPGPAFPEPEMPQRIGHYRIIAEIGRGGMGLVYSAARDDGLFDQAVAIKVIRRTILSAGAADQFANERRILARLHHPHIAHLFDGGTDDSGAPYIIMELIDGVPITVYASTHQLNLAARLALFAQACDAIDYAHRALVVHADVKPSNVVVAKGFGVKLLDFGIARLVDDDRATHVAHTPGYSSPARVAGERAVPADDIFALGALLQTLCEAVDGVDADLMAVADKAASADPASRYGSIGELVDDIDRWIAHQPVRARPPDNMRALHLLWRRNRLALSFGVAAVLLLLATATVTTLLYIRANHDRAAAEQRFVEIRSLSDFLLSDAVTALETMPGTGPLRARIAQRATTALDRLAGLPGAPLDVQVETASGYARIGEILSASDIAETTDPATGDAVLDKAEGMMRRLSVRLPARTDLRLALARILVARAIFEGTAKIDRARTFALLDEAQAILDPLIASGKADFQAQTARTEIDLLRGYVYADASDYQHSTQALDSAFGRGQRTQAHTQRERADVAIQLERANTLIGDARWYSGDKPGAALAYRAGLATYDTPGLGPDVRIMKRQLYGAYTVSSAIFERGQKQAALAVIRHGLALADRLRPFDSSAGVRRMAAIVQDEYAAELRELGHLSQAIAQSEAAQREFVAIAAMQPNNYQSVRSVPAHMRALGEMLRDNGDTARACALFAQADALWAGLAAANRVAKFDQDNDVAQVKVQLRRCPGQPLQR